MILRLLILFQLLSLNAFASAQAHVGDTECPAVVLVEYDPWRMVIGSDNPTFALYPDRHAIFRSDEGYKQVDLTAGEYNQIIKAASQLKSLNNRYDLTRATDQVTHLFTFCASGKMTFVYVYGSLTDDTFRRIAPPDAIADLYDMISNFTHETSKTWLPEKIEVMVWGYDYAPDASIVWPEEWPDLDHGTTVRRGEDSYSLFVDSTDFDVLKTFLASQNPKGAIEINGKKWAASLRYPFPNERSWMAGPQEE